VKQYDPSNNTDGLVSFSGQTGGFNFISVVESTPERLTFRVHGRGDGIDANGVLQLASTTPPKVKRLAGRALPPDAKLDDIQLDAAVRQKTIDAIGEQLTDHYICPDVAAKMIQAIHEHQEHGDYNSMTDGNDFADALSRDLRAVSHAEQARFRTMLEHQNCTFSKHETLNHNVGYVKFDAFPPPEFCGPTVVAAMNFVANTDALIFDLRQNHGGDPSMVDFMVSYLFREPTHINDLNARDNNETPLGSGAAFYRQARVCPHLARPVNPVTKGDWEGTGVEPEVKVSAADALATAEKLAADKLANKSKPD